MTDPALTAGRSIARAKSSRQLRAAASVTLAEITNAYPLADRVSLFSSRTRTGTRRQLDMVRMDVERQYKRLADIDRPPAGELGNQTRAALGKAWNELAALRAEVGAFESWSGLEILAAAVVDAPRVLMSGVRAGVEGVGNATGDLLGSILKGFWPVLLILALVVVGQASAQRRGYL